MMFYVKIMALLSVALGPTKTDQTEKPAVVESNSVTQILILKEGGIGSASTGQQYVDRLVKSVARVNQWPTVQGKFQTNRSLAESWISKEKPDFAILSIAAFLHWRTEQELQVVGAAEVGNAGGRSYHIVSKTQKDLTGCQGKSLASDHLSDKKFLERVVARGAFTYGDFVLQETRRPVQTIKKVIRDQAVCALIDDAQLKGIKQISGGEALHAIWNSKSLPPMVVVAFPQVANSKKSRFKKNLSKVCRGEGESACQEAGISKLSAAGTSDYREVISAYGN